MSSVTMSPKTVVDDPSVGSVAWDSPDSAKTSDDAYTTNIGAGSVSDTLRDYRVSIIKSNGTIGNTNRAKTSTSWPSSDTYVTYGSSSDLWGETDWSYSKINDVDFGIVVSVYSYFNDDEYFSHYLKATNFEFDIPINATINGVSVDIEKKEIH